jgi:NitT/TauT family transport system permease protein
MLLAARVRDYLPPALVILAFFVVWETAIPVFGIAAYILPPPTDILSEFFRVPDRLWAHTVVTLGEILVGFGLGTVIGVGLAIAIAQSRVLEKSIYPIIIFLHTVPKLAIAPIFVLWFGFGLMPKIIVVIIVCFFPITVNTIYGLTSVDRNLIDLMHSVSATNWQILMKVRIPNSIPHLFAGLKIAVTLAVIGAIIAEWVGSDQGLGFAILLSSTQLQTKFMFAAITTISLIGVALFYLVSLIERLAMPWQAPVEVTRSTTV